MAMKRFCVPDLMKERTNCPFKQEEITVLLDGDEEKTKLRKKLEDYLISDPEFNDPISSDFFSHEELYSNCLKKAIALLYKLRHDEKLQALSGKIDTMRLLVGSQMAPVVNRDGNPLQVHFVMFLPAILGHGTIEQQAYWLTKAWDGEIIGTYAQTELGHGTFLRGLETTATYDEKNEEFILNSPTITSYKWWPGGLGKTANCAVVMAQLYVKNSCKGPHPFIVQIRDSDTHESLSGVIVGEIGPRLGLNTVDNGFLAFRNHRIPRLNMLMQHSQVLKDGTYIAPKNEKLVYGTMIFVRVVICYDVTQQLQKAVTIATRYSAVRRQSELIPGAPEPQILDYKTQQQKIFPYISTVFAMTFAARYIFNSYNECSAHMDKGNLELLPELHALACGLKAQSTSDAADGIDILRRSCGGHGYMASSNFPRLWSYVTATCTYEGENTVLWLQLARYLIKWVHVTPPTSSKSLHYLSIDTDDSTFDFSGDLSNEAVLKRWSLALCGLVRSTFDRLKTMEESGKIFELCWNECSVDLVKCAQGHIRLFTCNRFVSDVSTLSDDMSNDTKLVLSTLCRLYIVHHVIINHGLFIRYGKLSAAELSSLEAEFCVLLSKIRPIAVSIVDAFDIHDRFLDSTLGAWDGDVYNRLLTEAKRSPLNKTDVTEAYKKYLKPMRAKL